MFNLEIYSSHIGIVGVLLILLAYFLLQNEMLSIETLCYSLLNLIGALLILVSLFYHWNLPSVLIEIAWILISIRGIYRYYSNKNKAS